MKLTEEIIKVKEELLNLRIKDILDEELTIAISDLQAVISDLRKLVDRRQQFMILNIERKDVSIKKSRKGQEGK